MAKFPEPIIPRPIFSLLLKWGLGRYLIWILKIVTLGPIWKWIFMVLGTGIGYFNGLMFWLFPGLWTFFFKQFTRLYTEAMDNVAAPIAHVFRQITGLSVSDGDVESVITGGVGTGGEERIGKAFATTFDEIFDWRAVSQGYEVRNPGLAERANFERFMGKSFRLQAGSIAANLFKDRLPFGLGHGFEDIGDRIEKIFGFEDAFEETLEPLMEFMITEGIKKDLNRKIEPTDLTPGDAIDAYIRNYIGEQTFRAIMSNEGVRKDVIPVLINLKAKNLTEADFRDLYQRGAWTRDDVFTGYRSNGYLEEDAQDKTNLILQDREWQLRKELLNVKETQFAHGILDEGSLRNYLATLHFTAIEEDIEIEIAKGKASLTKTAKPKQITGTFNVAPWRVKPGATAMMSWNIRNATNITISGIGAVGARGERVITPDISQTYYLDASNDTDTERFEAAVQVGDTTALKRPTASFSASPGRITMGTPVELKWSTSGADSVSIDGVGGVAEAGAIPVFPSQSTIYTLRATNAQGTTIRQDIVFVNLPDVDLDRERRPGIAFAITPGVVSPKQNQTELTWTLTRAENGELTFPDGSTKNVGRNGALIFHATDSGIFTLKATNLFGTTQNQQAVIMKVTEGDEPPPPPDSVPPVLLLSISPMTAKPGENLFIFYTISGAATGTLVFPDATTRVVGASGNENYPAPAVAGTYEFRLQATNPAGPSQQSVTIVVSTAG